MRHRQQLRTVFSQETTNDNISRSSRSRQQRRRNAVRAAEETASRRGLAVQHPSTERKGSERDTLTIVIDETSSTTDGPSTMAKEVAVVAPPVEAIAVQHLLRTASSVDYAVVLLRLALADVIGGRHPSRAQSGGSSTASSSRRVYLMTLYRAFPSVVWLRYLWYRQVLVVGLLVMGNAGALYFLVSKAAVRGYAWQISFLKIAMLEWVSEVVLLQSLEIALFDYALCALVQREVEQAIATLLCTTTLSTTGTSKDAAAVGSHQSPPPSTRWISLALVHHWPRLLESRWVEASARQWASESHSTMQIPAAAADVKVACLSSAWWKTWLARGSFEVWEATVAFGAPLVFAWVLYVYYTYIAGGLDALSPQKRSVVIAVVVVVVAVGAVVWWMWRQRRRSVHAMNTLSMVATTADTTKGPAISHRMVPSPSVERNEDVSLQWSMSSSMDDDYAGGSWDGSWDGSWRDAHSDSHLSNSSRWRWSDESMPVQLLPLMRPVGVTPMNTS